MTFPSSKLSTAVERAIAWRPHPGPQEKFLASSAYEALYGGAAGGGKSDALLVGALYGVENRHYSAILFRRTFAELERSLIERSRILFPRTHPAASYSEKKRVWRFLSGAQIHFGHLEHPGDVRAHQSAEYQYIAFDELTHFLEQQYLYLLSRARSAHGIPVVIRSATNPGGEGHEWVFRRWGPWLDPHHRTSAEPGEKRWYRNTPEGEEWLDQRAEGALSRVFFPARLCDNPSLSQSDPGYAVRLDGLDPVTRAQLKEGNWLVKPAAGLLFKRAWFKIVDAAPAEVESRVRRWDLAATTPTRERPDPDWTVGVRVAKTADGVFVVEDVLRLRDAPGVIERTVKSTAELDGRDTTVLIPQDPGQAGKVQLHAYQKLLAGFDVRSETETGDKETRARPASAQAHAGNIHLVRASWNEPFIRVLEEFPDGTHDDDVDALSGAIVHLASHVRLRYEGWGDVRPPQRRI
jgi:predicted phage terminase large subunit-like protein